MTMMQRYVYKTTNTLSRGLVLMLLLCIGYALESAVQPAPWVARSWLIIWIAEIAVVLIWRKAPR